MNRAWSLRRRIEPTSLTALVAVGDLLAIATFVVAGELSHGYGLLEYAGRIAATLVTFLVGWAVVSVPGRLYSHSTVGDLETEALRTLGAWALAVGIAQALRSTAVFPGDFAPTFALVSFGFGGALLVGWRALVSIVR